MRNKLALLITAMLAAAPPVASADWIARQTQLADVSKANTTAFVKDNVTVLGTSTNSLGQPVASLSFNGYRSSIGQTFSTARDWSPYNIVHLTMTNREGRGVLYRLIVRVRSGEHDYTDAFIGEFGIGKYQTRNYVFYLNTDDPRPYGMKYLNPVLRNLFTGIPSSKARDLRTVYHWRISSQDSNVVKADISDLRLIRQSLDFTGLADKYGQYTDRDWSAKIKADSDFESRKASELTDLSAYPGKGETFGTTSLTNPAPVPGKWAIVPYSNGKLFLQHPNGRLFWSVGLNGVNDSLATPIEGRENYFQALPSTTGRFASCYSVQQTTSGAKDSYSFRKQNLMIKYGDSYLTPWSDMVRKRLASWGVNTLGIDSSRLFLDGKVPYTLVLSTSGFGTRFRPPLVKWGSLPDPFASTFQSWANSEFSTRLTNYKSSQQLMGVFVDNELSWGNMSSTSARYNLALGALAAASTQPAKQIFVQRLRNKYGTISALNTAWGTSFSSFEEILETRTWKPTTYTSQMHADFQGFCYAFADKYFTIVRSALTYAGLPSLYLGCRFADYTAEVVNAASLRVNVLSYNVYRYVEDVDWGYLNSRSKPVLISEHSFTMQGMGTFGGPAAVPNPAERAWRMKQFFDAALAHKNIVGLHWYCFADQPITGRWSDGENGGFGMVDVGDTPYQESVTTFRNFTNSMYAVRSGTATSNSVP